MKGNNFSYISWYNVGAHVAIFIPQKCRRSERYFRYKNTCPMLIKLGNIGKVFCMNGFPGRPEKRDIKREETKVEIWPSHILFTAYNRTFITVCIELELVVGSYSLGRWSAGALLRYLLVYILQLSMEHIPSYLGKSFRDMFDVELRWSCSVTACHAIVFSSALLLPLTNKL